MEGKNTMNTQELQSAVNDYQQGKVEFKPEIPMNGMQPKEENTVPPTTDLSRSLYNATKASLQYSPAVAIDDTASAVAQGFGTSKYDSNYYEGKDLEQSRAIGESDFAKITAGLAKGGVTALTTAANTTIGTIFGLGSGLFELAFDGNGNGRSFMDTVDAGVNNQLSQKLIEIQDWSEKAFPNYKTQQERTEQWQRDWFKPSHWNANFVGDNILKNFGFTLGAIPGGVFWSKLIGAGMSRKFAGDIMKGVAMGSEGDAAVTAEMTRIADGLKKGTITIADGQKLVQNMSNVAKQLNRAESRLQFYGAAFSAMGEGSSEGLMAKNEFLQEFTPQIDQAYKDEYDRIEQDIIAEKDPYKVKAIRQYNADGTVGVYYDFTPFGLTTLMQRRMEVNQKYNKIREDAQQQAQRLAATTWLLNLPILTLSNQIQFARVYSGGWKTNRLNSAKTRGGIHLDENKITSDYSKKGSVLGKALGKSLKVALSEGNEEMMQGVASSGTKQVAKYRLLSEFNNDGYDEEATNSARTWFLQMAKGGGEYLTDIKNWQEGALGAFTGLLGIPGKHWHGGVYEAVKDAKAEVNASKTAAENLNKYIRTDDFQNRWRNYIRHTKYDNDMAKAVVKDDEYAWHTADDKQLINDVVTFADEGKLQDLIDFATAYSNISDEQAEAIKAELTSKSATDGQADPNGLANSSTEEIKKKVKKQADKLITAVQEYGEIYSNMRTRLPANTSSSFLKEIVATAMEIRAYDKRFLTMLDETLKAIDPLLSVMASVDEKGNMVTDAEEHSRRFKNLQNKYETLFAGSLIPLDIPSQIKVEAALNILEETAKKVNPDVAKKVADMKKLSKARQDYYGKLQTLQEPKAQEKFNEQAVTQEKVETITVEQAVENELKSYDTLGKIKQEYWSRDSKGKGKFITLLQQAKGKGNKAIDTFLELNETFRKFNEFLVSSGKYMSDPNDNTVIPNMIASLTKDAFQRAKSKEEFLSMADNLFESRDEFNEAFSGIFGAVSSTAYESSKNRLRAAVAEYKHQAGNEETRQKARQQLEEQKKQEEQARREGKPVKKPTTSGAYVFIEPSEHMIVPEGYDASAPASTSESPSEWIERKKKEGEKNTKERNEVAVAIYVDKDGSLQPVYSLFDIKQDKKGVYHLKLQDTTYRCRFTVKELRYKFGDELFKAMFGEEVPEEISENTVISVESIDIYPDGHTEVQASLYKEHEGGSWSMIIKSMPDSNKFLQMAAPAIADRFHLLSNAEQTEKERDEQDEAINGVPVQDASAEERFDDEINDKPDPGEEEAVRIAEKETARRVGNRNYQTIYYRTGMPEIDSWEAKAAREAMSSHNLERRKEADLSDFSKKHPEYAKTWNALADRKAFDHVNTDVSAGDNIEFMVDPSFPEYNGEPQILMVKRAEDGTYQTLTTLSGQTDKYLGLQELREEIMSEYKKFKEEHPNDKFVFGKSSTVWNVRKGLMDYDYSDEDFAERPINSLAGFEQGSILYVSRDGKIHVVYGNGEGLSTEDERLQEKVINRNGKVAIQKKGRLYYFRHLPNGRNILVALKQRKFNENTKDIDNDTFGNVRRIINELSQLLQKGKDLDDFAQYDFPAALAAWNAAKESYQDDPSKFGFTGADATSQNEQRIAEVSQLLEEAAKQYNENKNHIVDEELIKQYESLVKPQKEANEEAEAELEDNGKGDNQEEKAELDRKAKKSKGYAEPLIAELKPYRKKTDTEEVQALNKEMHEKLGELIKYLDYHKWFFSFGHLEGIGLGLRINNGEESLIRRPDQLENDWLMDWFVEQNFSINAREDMMLAAGDKQTKKDAYQRREQFIKDGIFTANVRMLRPKGTDFYIIPYNPDSGKFEAMSEIQERMLQKGMQDRADNQDLRGAEEVPADVDIEAAVKSESESSSEENPTEAQKEQKEKEAETESNDVGESKNTAENFTDTEKATPAVVNLGGQEYKNFSEKEIAHLASLPYEQLPKYVQDSLNDKGISEDDFNMFDDDAVRENYIRCM